MTEDEIYDLGREEYASPGDYYYDPISDTTDYREHTPEEMDYLTTGNTRYDTGEDQYVEYRDEGVVETGDGSSRTFYTPDGGMVEYSNINNPNARVVTYTPDGKPSTSMTEVGQ